MACLVILLFLVAYISFFRLISNICSCGEGRSLLIYNATYTYVNVCVYLNIFIYTYVVKHIKIIILFHHRKMLSEVEYQSKQEIFFSFNLINIGFEIPVNLSSFILLCLYISMESVPAHCAVIFYCEMRIIIIIIISNQ